MGCQRQDWNTERQNACPTCLLRYGQEYCLTKSDLNPAAETQLDTPTWLIAVRAAEAKQATDIKVLDLTGITSFADYFVICTGSNSKQIQAISDEVGIQLKRQAHELPNSLEGYNQSEWVLADRLPVRVQVQLHKFIWDPSTRGV